MKTMAKDALKIVVKGSKLSVKGSPEFKTLKQHLASDSPLNPAEKEAMTDYMRKYEARATRLNETEGRAGATDAILGAFEALPRIILVVGAGLVFQAPGILIVYLVLVILFIIDEAVPALKPWAAKWRAQARNYVKQMVTATAIGETAITDLWRLEDAIGFKFTGPFDAVGTTKKWLKIGSERVPVFRLMPVAVKSINADSIRLDPAQQNEPTAVLRYIYKTQVVWRTILGKSIEQGTDVAKAAREFRDNHYADSLKTLLNGSSLGTLAATMEPTDEMIDKYRNFMQHEIRRDAIGIELEKLVLRQKFQSNIYYRLEAAHGYYHNRLLYRTNCYTVKDFCKLVSPPDTGPLNCSTLAGTAVAAVYGVPLQLLDNACDPVVRPETQKSVESLAFDETERLRELCNTVNVTALKELKYAEPKRWRKRMYNAKPERQMEASTLIAKCALDFSLAVEYFSAQTITLAAKYMRETQPSLLAELRKNAPKAATFAFKPWSWVTGMKTIGPKMLGSVMLLGGIQGLQTPAAQQIEAHVAQTAHDVGLSVGQTMQHVETIVGQAVVDAKEATVHAAERVQKAAGHAMSQVKLAAGVAAEQVKQAATHVSQDVNKILASDNVQEMRHLLHLDGRGVHTLVTDSGREGDASSSSLGASALNKGQERSTPGSSRVQEHKEPTPKPDAEVKPMPKETSTPKATASALNEKLAPVKIGGGTLGQFNTSDDLNALKAANASGYTLAQLPNVHTLEDSDLHIIKEAGYKRIDMVNATPPFTDAQIKAAGFHNAPHYNDLLNPGLFGLGTTGDDARALTEAHDGGIKLKDLPNAKQLSTDHMKWIKQAGYKAEDMREAHFRSSEIKAAGFTPSNADLINDRLLDAKGTPDALKALNDAKLKGVPLKDLYSEALQKHPLALKQADYTTQNLNAAGPGAQLIDAANLPTAAKIAEIREKLAPGFGWAENRSDDLGALQEAHRLGIKLKDLPEVAQGSKYLPFLKEAGYNAEDMRSSGLWDQSEINKALSNAHLSKDALNADLQQEFMGNKSDDAKALKLAKESHYSLSQLPNIKQLPDDQLKLILKAGYSPTDMAQTGWFSPDKIQTAISQHAAPYNDLLNPGFLRLGNTSDDVRALTEAQNEDIKLKDLPNAKQLSTDHMKWIKQAGYKAEDMREAHFRGSEIKAAGFPLTDADRINDKLVDAKGFGGFNDALAALKEAKLKGVPLKDLYSEAVHRYPLALKQAGFSAHDLQAAGVGDLVQRGGLDRTSLNTDLKQQFLGDTSDDLRALKAAHDSKIGLTDLKNVKDMPDKNLHWLKEAGYTRKDMLDSKLFSVDQVDKAGLSATKLNEDLGNKVNVSKALDLAHRGGIKLTALPDAKFVSPAIVANHYSVADMQEANFSPSAIAAASASSAAKQVEVLNRRPSS